jgi:hypothetical protein
MIAGNEASIIARCLDSAASAFDKLCLVQAVGEASADDTLDIARAWCIENKKDYTLGTYRNKSYPDRAKLQHVDDFAAARNLSFDLAFSAETPDWILWLDCDDYLDELNCRRIREAVRTAPADWNGLFCSYLIEKHGAVIQRERLIRTGKGRWKNAIHETCVIEGGPTRTGQCPQIEVYHSDHSAKHGSSAARNLAILERVLEDAPRHYFYLHAELKMLGKKEEAVRAARAALQLLDASQVEERYMIHLNLSELEPDHTMEHLLGAVRLQPHRREAFAYLCQKSLIDGDLSDAISYFRLMDALPLPSPLPWTHQGLWYGWARNFLRVRVLRASGKSEQAEKEHAEHLKDPEYAAGVEEFERKQEVKS